MDKPQISLEFRLALIKRANVPITEEYFRKAINGERDISKEIATQLINAWALIREECVQTFPNLPQLRPWHINRKWRQIWPELTHQIDAPQSADKPPALA